MGKTEQREALRAGDNGGAGVAPDSPVSPGSAGSPGPHDASMLRSLSPDDEALLRELEAVRDRILSLEPYAGAKERAQGVIVFRVAERLSLPTWNSLCAQGGLPDWQALPIADNAWKTLERVRRLERELLVQAGYDPLTGLAARLQFESFLDMEIERGLRTGSPYSLALLRIDAVTPAQDFQNLALALADVLIRSKRRYDMAARLDDNLFALLLSGAALVEAASVVTRLQKAFRQRAQVSCSAGLASGAGRPNPSVRELVDAAGQVLGVAAQAANGRLELAEIHEAPQTYKESLVLAQEKQFLFFGG